MTDQDHNLPSAPPPMDGPRAGEPFAAPEPIRTTPVATPPRPAAGRSRVRWLAALVVTVVVVAVAAAGTLLLTGSAGDPGVLSWAPKDSIVYSELRLDLPGSQETELAKVMQAFPGFDDQAAFPTKLSEALDQLVKRASSDQQSYVNDIEPWFGGQLSISVGPLPATADATAARGLLLASVTDSAKATAWADKLLATTGASSSTETYSGVTITTVTPPASTGASGMAAAYAAFGPVIGLGDVASVKAAIDTKGTAGLATNDQFKTAEASVSDDRLGFAYVDTAAIAKGAMNLAGDAAASAMPEIPAALSDAAPPWAAAALRAANGSFVIDTRMPHVSTIGTVGSAESTLPAVLPPTTIAFIEGHDVGKALEQLKTTLAADPQLTDGVTQLDDALKLVGGYGALVDWMGEGGIAVTRDGDTIDGGIVITPTDKAAADRLFTQLRAFVALAGATSGISVTDEAYGDATITVVDLGDLSSLAGAMTGGSVSGIPANITIAYSITDKVIAIGSGTGFVKAVLDARTGDSLAGSDRFSSALGAVDKSHGSLLWLDVAGIRSFAETQLPASAKSDYDTNTKPYLDAFDSVIASYTPGDTLDRGTVVIRVSGQ
jgi:hypothetical protein